MLTQTVSAAERNFVHDEHATHDTERPTPLPKFQIFIVFFDTVCRTYYWFGHLSVHVLQSVRQRDITNGDERKTGYYAGIIVWWSLPPSRVVCTHLLIICPGICFFFSQRLLLSFNGAIYQTVLDVGLFYFWLHLAWRLQCLSSVLRLHLFPLLFRVCLMATSVCKPT